MAGPADFAVIGSWPGEELPLREIVRRFLPDAEIVLAEGFKNAPEPKIEIFRGHAHRAPLLDPQGPSGHPPLLALVTDREDIGSTATLFRLQDPDYVSALADLVEESFLDGVTGRPHSADAGGQEGGPP
jgi:hypothetical protein